MFFDEDHFNCYKLTMSSSEILCNETCLSENNKSGDDYNSPLLIGNQDNNNEVDNSWESPILCSESNTSKVIVVTYQSITHNVY